MTPTHVENLKDAYTALNQGDPDAALVHAHDDFVVNRAGPDPPVRGKDAVRAFVAPDAFSEQVFEPLEFRVNEDIVFVWLRVRATGAGSGITMEQEAAHVWRFRDGKVVALTVSFDRAEALEVAGMPA